MIKQQSQLIQDLSLIIISILAAIFFVQTSAFTEFIISIGELKWIGIFFAGIFFTSIFTTIPAIALLGEFSQTTPFWIVAIIAGLGAVLGDYLIFYIAKNRFSEDIEYLLSFSRKKRYRAILKTKLIQFLLPFIGALIIASPFPDEVGVTMMGLSGMKRKTFFIMSFALNGAGILFMLWIADIILHYQ